jgi:hypothetical protein
MRRSSRHRFPRTSSISVMPRVMSMITMLAVVAMIIYRARDPGTWRWLARLDGAAPQRAPSEQPAISAPAAKSQSPTPSTQTAAHAPPEPVATGPTDEDPEQADAFKEECQAVTDRIMSMKIEEMAAYDRVVGWVVNQPFSVLRKRARTDVSFNDLIQSPGKHRGQVIELELNVRQLLKSDAQIPSGVQLYEARGFSNDSGCWLYYTIVVDLPKDMPVGPHVDEQVRFVGYFFKDLSYLPALAKPRDPPLPAPVLIGRLVWKQIEVPKVQQSDWTAGYLLIGGFVLIAAVNLFIMYRRNRRRPGLVTAILKPRTLSVDDWLDQAGTDEAATDETPGDAPPAAGHDAATPPTSNGERKAFPKGPDGPAPSAD